MAPTSPLPGGDTHIRVIPADQDPRLRSRKTPNANQQLPSNDEENFPSLVANTAQLAITIPTWTLRKQTFSEVLVMRFRPFLQLPVEIRELVWEASMRADNNIRPSPDASMHVYWVYPGNGSMNPHFLPQVCLVSKSMRDETIGVFMRNTMFAIPSIVGNQFFRQLIATVKDGSKHVRALFFPNFDFFPDKDRVTGERIEKNSDLELAVDCLGLRKVRMKFGLRHLHFSVQELLEKYRLRRLLDCENLETVHLDGKDYGYCMAPEVLDHLADWIKAEFASKNREVNCFVTWRY
jgi:hypothetical protein